MKIRLFGSLLVMALVVSLGVVLHSRLGWQSARQSAPQKQSAALRTPSAHVVLKIEGRDCVLCAAGLQNNLRALKGVHSAEVSFQDMQAVIDYDPNAATVADFAKVIADSAFKVSRPAP